MVNSIMLLDSTTTPRPPSREILCVQRVSVYLTVTKASPYIPQNTKRKIKLNHSVMKGCITAFTWYLSMVLTCHLYGVMQETRGSMGLIHKHKLSKLAAKLGLCNWLYSCTCSYGNKSSDMSERFWWLNDSYFLQKTVRMCKNISLVRY